MTEPSPTSQYHVSSYEPDPLPTLEELMSDEQARQFLGLLRAIIENGRGQVTIIIKNHHVRWLQGGDLIDFTKP